MQEQQIEVRKIGKKTYFYMALIVVLGIIFYLIAENGKVAKATKILHELGFEKIENVKVHSIQKVEDMTTKVQGYRYFVKFNNTQKNEFCEGFILKDFKHKVDKDLTCTKVNK